jgi:hypothetical protein
MTKLFRIALMMALVSIVSACSAIGDYSYMKEGEPHAEAIVHDVSHDWNADKLIAVTDPRMLSVFPAPEIRKMIAACADRLGSVKQQKTIMGSTGIETSIPGMTALYLIELDADKGNALIRIKLQKNAGQWKVLGFWVEGRPKDASKSPH